MAHYIDLTNHRYGILTVLSFSHKHQQPNGAKRNYWRVRCDCGKEFLRKQGTLRGKKKEVQSCGCLVPEQTGNRTRTHGLKNSKSYNSWRGMVARCIDPKHPAWKHYGGRGIEVCDRWKTIENFLEDMGEKPEGMTLERIDVNQGYNKENCKWITQEEQTRNCRSNIWLTANGRRRLMVDWARDLGCKGSTIKHRLMAGWPEKDAVTIPLGRSTRWRENEYLNKA